MRINLVFGLVTFALINLNASTYAQRISLTAKGYSLKNVIKEIEKQSGYAFLYEDELLKNSLPVSVELKQEDVYQAISKSLEGQPITFKIKDKTVVLQRKRSNVSSNMYETPDVAQQQQLSTARGKVVQEDGSPLPNATVRIKGTYRASFTDKDGAFEIQTVEQDRILEVSYVGHYTVEVPVKENVGTIVLTVNESLLEELVVTVNTGYKIVNDVEMTGAAAQISQKDYDQRISPSGNFLENLEGKIAGLVYNSQSQDLSIRGVSTFDAVKKPLIVLDGFPTEIDINTINPNDIKSVTVLKDAAAASIYGTRATNGVIVIETKRGQSGKTVFNLRATSGFTAKPDFSYMNYADSWTIAQVERDQLLKSTTTRAQYNRTAISELQDIVFSFKEGSIDEATMNQRLKEMAAYDNLNDYQDLFYRPQWTNQVDFDMSGGSDKHTYLLGVNYVGDHKNYIRTSDQRILLNFASTHQLNKRMNLDFKATYTNSFNRRPLNEVGVNSIASYERFADENGKALPSRLGPNRANYDAIIAENNEGNINNGLYDMFYYAYDEPFASSFNTTGSAIRLQARLNTKITDWLSFDLGGAYEDQPYQEESLRGEQSFFTRKLLNSWARKDEVGYAQFVDIPKGDILSKTHLLTRGFTSRAQFNVNHSTEDLKHSISGIVGGEIRKTINSSNMTSYFGYDSQTLLLHSLNYRDLRVTRPTQFDTFPFDNAQTVIYNNYFNEQYDDRRFASFYADGAYVYNQKYALTGSIRFDQSNLFGTDPKYRYKPFYSIGANWSLHQESFLQDVAWIDVLRLRGAYGVNGNTPTSASSKYLILESDLSDVLVTDNPLYNGVLTPQNNSIRWERTENINAGLDYVFLRGKLSGSIDYYLKNSSDVFANFSSDPTSGFNNYVANSASIQNHGLELSLYSQNIIRPDFRWGSQLTASFNKNKITEVKTVKEEGLGALLPLISTVEHIEDYPLDALFAYNYAGLNTLGQPEIFDRNGDRRLVSSGGTSTSEIGLEDMVFMGTTTPRYVIGLNNQFTYRNFDLSFLFMYYGGHVMRTPFADAQANGRLITPGSENHWAEPGDELLTDIPAIPEQGTEGYFNEHAKTGYSYASKFVKKADMIRLRDIVLTYNFNPSVLSRWGLSNTQIRAQLQNVFRYTFSGNDIDSDAINRSTGIRQLPQRPMFSLSLYTNF